MIVILTGAKKNVGDYLIGSRSRKLLSQFVDSNIVELDRFRNLDQHIGLINKSRAVFLCGGPAYTQNIYPGIYPLVSDLEAINVPIIPFGLGWGGRPFHRPDEFNFDSASKEFLDKIHNKIVFSSCRDDITLSILKRHGYDNVMMTGCPVWYHLDYIGKKLQKFSFDRIVYTTPATPRLIKQNHILMKKLRQQFPHAEIVCSFHRGILPDKYTSIRYSAAYAGMALDAKMQGFKVIDSSYDLEKISFYNDFDFHVGYRLHAHLDFLSRRKPSVLINEDGRGVGMVRSLGLPELNHDDPNLVSKYKGVIAGYQSLSMKDLDNAISTIESKFYDMKLFLKNCC